MNSKRKRNLFEVFVETAKIFFASVTVVLFLVFVIGEWILPDERDSYDTECQVFDVEWQQVLENGEKTPVKIPGKIQAERGEVVTITTMLPEETYNGQVICFRPIWQDVNIYINGQLRQRYSTEETRLFGTNSAPRYVFVNLYEEDAGKELTYQFSSNSKYAGNMEKSYIGNRASIWIHLIKDSGARNVVSIFLLVLCLFCIIFEYKI